MGEVAKDAVEKIGQNQNYQQVKQEATKNLSKGNKDIVKKAAFQLLSKKLNALIRHCLPCRAFLF